MGNTMIKLLALSALVLAGCLSDDDTAAMPDAAADATPDGAPDAEPDATPDADVYSIRDAATEYHTARCAEVKVCGGWEPGTADYDRQMAACVPPVVDHACQRHADCHAPYTGPGFEECIADLNAAAFEVLARHDYSLCHPDGEPYGLPESCAGVMF
jgi:hypothetical protein